MTSLVKISLLLGLIALSGCSLRYDFAECKTDGDCEALEQSGELLQCVSEECVPITGIECRTSDDCTDPVRNTCSANQCVDPNPASDMGEPDMTENDMGEDMTEPDMPEPDMPDDMDNRQACTQNVECADLEGDNLCIEGFCQTLESPNCAPVIVGDELEATRTIVLGSILPKTNFVDIGPPLEQAIRLAVKEVNRTGGLPDGTNVVLVVCDDEGQNSIARAGARFLINDLKTPAIVGPIFSEAGLSVFNNVAKDAGVMMMLPTASVPSLTTLIDDGLVFRTIPSDVLQARAFFERVRELHAQQPRRILVFVKDDAYGQGLSGQLSGGGSNLSTIVGASNVYYVSYPDFAPLSQEERGQAVAAAVSTALSQFPNPNLILGLGTTEVSAILSGYFGEAGPIQTIVSHGGAPGLATVALASGGALTDNQTVTAIGPNIFDTLNYPVYLARFEQEYPGTPPTTISTITYDATMSVLLAMGAVPAGEPLTGANIAAAMPSIADKDGTKVSYGDDADYYNTAKAILQAGNTIDFRGVSGEVDFDSNGDIRSGYLGFTVFLNPNTNTYDLAPYRAFQFLSPTAGLWVTLCGGLPVAPPFATCQDSNFACVPVNTEGTQACLPLCDAQDPMCPSGLTCTPISQTAAVCAP